MGERGSSFKRIIDFVLGIPLVFLTAILRRLSAVFRSQEYAAETGWEPRKLALICLGAIGDTVLLSGLVRALSMRKIQIDIYTSKANEQAATLLPNIDNIYSFHLSEIPEFISKLRKEHYNYLIDSSQWARITAIISNMSGASVTVGFVSRGQFRSAGYDIRVLHEDDQHEWLNFMDLGQALFPGIFAQAELKAAKNAISMPPYIICHMWATGSHSKARQWPEEKWITLILELIKHRYIVFLSGSEADRAACKAFISKLPDEYRDKAGIIAGQTLSEFASMASSAAAVISVNTGAMHVASLAGASVIALHGPTSPLRWGPVGRRALALLPEGADAFLNLGFERLKNDSAYCYRLTVEQVFSALKEIDIL